MGAHVRSKYIQAVLTTILRITKRTDHLVQFVKNVCSKNRIFAIQEMKKRNE